MWAFEIELIPLTLDSPCSRRQKQGPGSHIHRHADLTQQREDLQHYPTAEVKATYLGGQDPHRNSESSSRPPERTSVGLNRSD